MIPHTEFTGGFVGQLRGYATKGSDRGLWAEAVPQTVEFSHESSLPGVAAGSISAAFLARKIRNENDRLATSYHFRVNHRIEELHFEELPAMVLANLRKTQVLKAEGGEEHVLRFGGEDEPSTDVVYEEVFDTDVENKTFSYDRSLVYSLDARGRLVRYSRTQQYTDDEEPDVDAHIGRYIIQGTFKGQTQTVSELTRWTTKKAESLPTNLPDSLKELEEECLTSELMNDIDFWELVRSNGQRIELEKYTRDMHRQSMMAIFAFLRLEIGPSELSELL